ncbi:MAG: cell division protein FtsQ/DivIB [Eubacteriales bacterium]
MPSLYSARHSHPKKRRWHIIQSLFFIFVLFLAVFFFLQSSFFRVKDIQIQGNKQLPREEVAALTGLVKGVNIFKANLKEAQNRVALHPIIKQVDISRILPATIVINLTERKPIGLIANPGHFISVSDDGYYLSRVNNLSSLNLPIITGVKILESDPGQELTDEKLKAALDYLLAMPLNIRAAVSEINVSDLNNIRIFTIDKAEVRLGDTGRINDKIKLYREVIGQKYQSRIQYIDISYRGNPVVKLFEPPKQEKQQQPQQKSGD